MAPKRTTRSTPVTPAPTATTTTVTEAQLQALIDQGVAAAMAEAEASRVRNGYNSNGTEGVVGLTRWFEKMESVFSISNCTASCQVKFATCTLQDDALTWWNAHVKTTTPEAAHAMPWATLKKMMTDKYCPRGEIKKIETEMWNLKVKGTDVVAYSRRFQQLALMCSRMFPEEIDRLNSISLGLPDMRHWQCKGHQKPKNHARGIECTTELMGWRTTRPMLKVKRKVTKSTESIFLRTIKTNNNRTRGRTQARPTLQASPQSTPVTVNHTPGLNLCVPSVITIMKVLVHLGAITARGWLAILAKDCRSRPANANNNNRTNNNNKLEGAPAKVYVVGNAGANLDNVIAEVGSFDAIIGMDWLTRYQAVNVCAEKIVRIPWRNETLIIQGDGSNQGNVTRLNIISCTKTQKYMEKGFPIFLAHVTAKEVEDKSEKKRLRA
ncbi:putative reverse transcriptase domain-containing protein [Tanacetum coccineum]